MIPAAIIARLGDISWNLMQTQTLMVYQKKSKNKHLQGRLLFLNPQPCSVSVPV